PRGVHHEPVSLRTYFGRVRARLDAHRLLLMLASLLTFVVLYGSYLTYVPFHMDARFGAPPTVIGAVFFSASAATMLVSLRLAPITERIGRRRALVLAYALYAIAMFLVPRLPSVPWM